MTVEGINDTRYMHMPSLAHWPLNIHSYDSTTAVHARTFPSRLITESGSRHRYWPRQNKRDRWHFLLVRTSSGTSYFFSRPPAGAFEVTLRLEEGRGQWDTQPAHTCTAPVFGSCISATRTRSLPPSFVPSRTPSRELDVYSANRRRNRRLK